MEVFDVLTPMQWAAVAGVVVLALVVGLWVGERARRRRALRARFGPTYDHAVERYGSRSRAEAELRERERRFEKAHLRPLTDAERERYAEMWRTTQARFVDDPAAAVGEADFLVSEVMRLRGYPAGDFEQRLADVAVGHPQLVDHYRDAWHVAERRRAGTASTEDLRQALVHYRALFDELLEVRARELAGTRR